MAKAAEKAYVLVKKRILGGEYPPAFRLTEQEIADASGVSRTPVREALQRLQSEGFVRVTTNQGAVVVDWNDGDADEVFELRGLLEPYGAARAATRIDAEGIARLRALANAQFEEASSRKPGFTERIGRLNSEFHRTVHQYAGNSRLSAVMPMLVEAPLVMRTFSKYEPDELVRSASHHVELVNALEARNPEWAAAVMRSHVYAAQNRICQHGGERAESGGRQGRGRRARSA